MKISGDLAGVSLDGGLSRLQQRRPGSESGASAVGSGGGSFAEALGRGVEQTNATILAADQSAADLVVGRSGDIHGTMIAMERADLEFRLMSAVRTKVIEAYREVMRMGV